MICRNKSRLLALVLLLMLTLTTSAFAFEPVDLQRQATFTLQANDNFDDMPLPGIVCRLYHIADMDELARFQLRDEYKDIDFDINVLETAADWESAAEALNTIALQSRPRSSGMTDENGRFSINYLSPGLYLIIGNKATIGDYIYKFKPFLIAIPTRDDEDNWVYDVVSSVKMDRMPRFINLEVVKTWDDDNRGTFRPRQVLVELLCDGEVTETITLGEHNNWHYTFENLPNDHEYSFNEMNFNPSYKPEYSIVDGVYVIHNRFVLTPTPTTDIPSTGQLWWPVPVLAGAGMILFVIGWIYHRKWSHEHEAP